jgi:hypothetical protein
MTTFTGKLVSVHGNTLVVAHDDGLEHEHPVAPGAVISRDGAPATLNELQVGDRLVLGESDPAVSVVAASK